jgi:hypothetical protein
MRSMRSLYFCLLDADDRMAEMMKPFITANRVASVTYKEKFVAFNGAGFRALSGRSKYPETPSQQTQQEHCTKPRAEGTCMQAHDGESHHNSQHHKT